MKPIYIFFSKVLFDDQKKVVLKSSKNDKVKKVLLFSNKTYFITSMKCFIKLDNDLTDWKEHHKFYQKYVIWYSTKVLIQALI